MSFADPTAFIEWRLLSGITVWGEIPAGLTDDLLGEERRHLLTEMRTCLKSRGTIDDTLFATHLASRLGGEQAMALLQPMLDVPQPADQSVVPGYLDALREAKGKRELSATLERIGAKIRDGDAPDKVRAEAITALRKLHTTGRNLITSVGETMPKVIQDLERRMEAGSTPGIPSGLSDMDALTGGWQNSDLIILAARPAVGKTAMALQFARHAAEQGKRVVFVSAEQPASQLVQRMLSAAGRIPIQALRNPARMSDADWSRVTHGMLQVQNLPIRIIDNPAPHVAEVAAQLEQISGEFDLVIIDYLQRLKGAGQGIYERVSDVVLTCKEMARTHDVPVITLAQISRAGAGGAGMEHLKGSGDIEQEADQVLILEQREVPSKDGDEPTKAHTLHIEKNRHGPVAEAPLYFDGPYLTFGLVARRHEQDLGGPL